MPQKVTQVDSILNKFQITGFKSIVIYGATASGKSALAEELLSKIDNSVIINADSMQVYSEIPIITAQPRISTRHRLYGMISCLDQSFSVARWLEMVQDEIKQDIIPIIVGGTGLYISSLLKGFCEVPEITSTTMENLQRELSADGLKHMHDMLKNIDPITADKICDPQRTLRALGVFVDTGKPISEWQANNKKLFDSNSAMTIWVKPERSVLYKRINNRFVSMIESGAVDEVQKLLDELPNAKYPKAIGIQQISDYLYGCISKESMIEVAQRLTRNYAKRQETWFRNQLSNLDLIIED